MAEAKKAAEVATVSMEDGRIVEFVGKRKVLKNYVLDEKAIETDGDVVQLSPGAVKLRMDFRNGATRTFVLPLSLIAQFAGHGAEQKYGDELASPADKPMSEDDMVLAVEDLDSRIQKGEWRVAREGGGGVSGASLVLQAFLLALNEDLAAKGKPAKDMAFVKSYMQGKLDAAEGRGEKLSRAELYASFKNPASKVGKIYARLEAEKAAKGSRVDADAELAAAA